MNKALLIITTANQLEYTKLAINSLRQNELQDVDVIIIDDCSVDGTIAYCRTNNIDIISKPKAKGLTDSWNIGYQLFKDRNYQNLILANNDILVPKGAIESLLKALDKHLIVGVLSTIKGVGHQQEQAVTNNYNLNIDDTIPENYQKIQDAISSIDNKQDERELLFVNGFFFGVNRKIINYEFDKGYLFNPKNVNVGNEDELCRRITDCKKYVCLRSFIYHYKGVSCEITNLDNQTFEGNVNRNLTWMEAQELRKNVLKRVIYKIKRKFKK